MQKIVLAVTVLFSGLLLFGGAWEASRLHQQTQWPTVIGVVKNARLFEAAGSNWIDVTYRYSVDGKFYTDNGWVGTDQTRRVPNAYREPAEISVHYDPTRPDQSYLEHPGFESPYALTIFGIVILLICFPFVVKQLLLVYADMMLRRARYHMREGLKALEGAQDELGAMCARGKQISQEFLAQESEVIADAKHVGRMLEELDRPRQSLQ